MSVKFELLEPVKTASCMKDLPYEIKRIWSYEIAGLPDRQYCIPCKWIFNGDEEFPAKPDDFWGDDECQLSQEDIIGWSKWKFTFGDSSLELYDVFHTGITTGIFKKPEGICSFGTWTFVNQEKNNYPLALLVSGDIDYYDEVSLSYQKDSPSIYFDLLKNATDFAVLRQPYIQKYFTNH